MEKLEKGDNVKLSYTARLENGKVFDTTEKDGPVSVKVGEGKLLKKIDEELLNMSVGEEKEIVLTPQEGFGPVKDTLQQTMSREMIKDANKDPKVGQVVQVEDPNKQMMIGVITNVSEQNIVVDFNHPLAGKTLTYKIKVESKE